MNIYIGKLQWVYTRHSEFFFIANQIVTTEKEANFKCNKAVKTMRLYIEFLNHHIQSDPGPLFEIIFVNNFLG